MGAAEGLHGKAGMGRHGDLRHGRGPLRERRPAAHVARRVDCRPDRDRPVPPGPSRAAGVRTGEHCGPDGRRPAPDRTRLPRHLRPARARCHHRSRRAVPPHEPMVVYPPPGPRTGRAQRRELRRSDRIGARGPSSRHSLCSPARRRHGRGLHLGVGRPLLHAAPRTPGRDRHQGGVGSPAGPRPPPAYPIGPPRADVGHQRLLQPVRPGQEEHHHRHGHRRGPSAGEAPGAVVRPGGVELRHRRHGRVGSRLRGAGRGASRRDRGCHQRGTDITGRTSRTWATGPPPAPCPAWPR